MMHGAEKILIWLNGIAYYFVTQTSTTLTNTYDI